MHSVCLSTYSNTIVENLAIVKTWQVICVPVGTWNRFYPPENLSPVPKIKLLPCKAMLSNCLGLLDPIYHTVAMPLQSTDCPSSPHTPISYQLATDGHKDFRRSYFLYL